MKKIWLWLADQCLIIGPRNLDLSAKIEITLGDSRQAGLCGLLLNSDFNFIEYRDILLIIRYEILKRVKFDFLFPCTVEGAKLRREFCLQQAEISWS